MKWLTVLAAVLTFGMVRPAEAAIEDKTTADKGVVGSWEGRMNVTPQVELRITLNLKIGADGRLSGTWGSPDQGANDLPMESPVYENGTLTFSAKAVQSSYKGKRNDAGTEIVGEWVQRGKAFALAFRRADSMKKTSIPRELEGVWQGPLQVSDGMKLRLALKIEKGKDGALDATLASPDQGANDIPISSLEYNDKVLTFESKVIGARFKGKQNDLGTEIDGEFNQGGMKLPLKLTKSDKIAEVARPQTPKAPFPYRSEDVKYENKRGGVRLAGTLTIPAGQGPFPAVILITGSGAQDRDETILGHKPFLVLADYLSRRGVAVLRVDDRGVGGSTGHTKSSTSDDFAGDVLAGVEFLKGRSEINARKLGLIGHSEGGIIAPIVATRSKDVAFVVLMAGTGLPGAQILEVQLQLILKASGSSESNLKTEREIQKRLIDIILAEKDEKAALKKLEAAKKEILAAMSDSDQKSLIDKSSGLSDAALSAINSPWFRYFLSYDPRPTLRTLKCPVLAINGEKDLQVPPKENLEEIRKAVQKAGNRNVKTVELPGLNHLFQPCKTGAPNEYASIETTIAPEALKTIGDWILDQTDRHQ
jgi:pimeloyl-ACP methyl ester carboxylesterase